MSLRALGSLLDSVPQFQGLMTSLERPRVRAKVQVLSDGVPFALATLWGRLAVPTLVITPRPEDARRLHEQLSIWSGDEDRVLHFPETETLPFERLVSDIDTVHQRLRTLTTLCETGGRPPMVVASTVAVTQKTIDREAFDAARHTIKTSQQVDLDELMDLWRRMGYQFESEVFAPGSATRRGGIIDVFPVGSDLPSRIELWGNEIDSIRRFDPSTQRSLEIVDSVDVTPAHETLPALTGRDLLRGQIDGLDVSNCTDAARDRIVEEFDLLLDGYQLEDLNFYSGFFNRGSLLDYFPRDGLVVAYRPSEVVEAALDTEGRAGALRAVKEKRGELPKRFPSSYFLWEEVEGRMRGAAKRLEVVPWGAEELTQEIHSLPFTSPLTFLGNLESFVEEAAELVHDGDRLVAMTSHSRRLVEILEGYGVDADLPESLEGVPAPSSVTLLQAEGAGLGDGFVLSVDGHKLVVLSDTEIFGVAKQRRSTRRTASRRAAVLSQLSHGDYVVHVEHGIGRFVGTRRSPEDEGGTEYLVLQYAQRDKLYVPMDSLDRVTPYVAPLDRPPTLTRLGTQEWKRTKERVERSTREMAAELLSLYATRELVTGHAFSPDAAWQAELEESFPFGETPDQLATIAEVKADMEAIKPMDRLVCGDVGYGKTEIALRAAFKAVLEGRQVAVLVPTTVLAQQHYVTFSQRLSAYPTRVEVLSRFRTDREQRQIIDGLATGQVDICIGTHRLIQKDVRFKDLGLVVIDEEQRFGVVHKERLKQMRQEVDVLTLTATPIPRTLHMSLAGVRDMSTMETPPEERLPIKTYVSEFSDELIREAILRELDRQGQVYFLHNRVHNIEYMAGYIRSLVPEAEIGIAHGQMPEARLERTMVDFAEGKMNVLVCTTIIESGLDIPNVNTLIVNRADNFGLAQLYQLRGRVGRSARRAYSYLLVPTTRGLTEAAERRLKTMLAATELGAGFHIAMKDLEIRGAGNILGAEQSGYIHALGFDLYNKLLSAAVEDLRARRAAGELSSEFDGDGTGASTPVDPASLDLVGPDGPTASASLAPPATPGVDLGIPASIPEEYISDLTIRLGIYQRLVQLTGLEGVEDMEDELKDRFGPLPWQVQNLLYVVRLRLKAQPLGVESVTRDDERIVIRFRDEIGGAKPALQRVLGRGVEVGHTQIRLKLDRLPDGWEKPLVETVEKLADFQERMASAMQPV